MKLEPDLIKDILKWGETNLPDKTKSWSSKDLEFTGYSTDQIDFHIKLLWQEGYIDCIDASSMSDTYYFFNHLTMNGYQYLNLLESKAWNTAKNLVHELGVIFVEGAIKAVIDKYSANLLS